VGAVVVSDGEGVGFGFFVLLGAAAGSSWLDGALRVADGLAVGVAVVGVGFFVGVGVGLGVGVGWGAGSACGRTVPVEPSQTIATYPPAGIASDPAPNEE
jgi:hypothetical protein